MPSADSPNRQRPHRQLVTDVHHLAWRAQLVGGLRVGVERGIRVAVEERRQPFLINMVLWGLAAVWIVYGAG